MECLSSKILPNGNIGDSQDRICLIFHSLSPCVPNVMHHQWRQ